jgi:UDP-N-acetylmuramate dehydrogenase
MSLLNDVSLRQLKHTFPQLKFKINFPLSKIAYFKIGGPAEAMVKAESRQDLIDLIQFCQKQDIKYTVLGSASNIIVSDEGVAGLVILAKHDNFQVINDSDDSSTVRVRADSGLNMTSLVKQTVNHGLTGLEQLVGVPGTLGGATYNNSHYLDFLISDCISQVEILNQFGEVIWLNKADCEFAYDSSRFQDSQEVILQVEFMLKKGDQTESQKLMRESTIYRMKTQPLGMPSSGCIFKNVPNNDQLKQLFPQFKDKSRVPAGFLIDQAGLKGMSQGSIQVSQEHGSFMVNTNGGTAKDVQILIEKVKQAVRKKFNVSLEEEVFYIE